MIDIKLIRENKELVKENIKKKFQNQKLGLVDEIEELDKKFREAKLEGDNLRSLKNTKSSEIGSLMREKKIEEANKIKEELASYNNKLLEIEKLEETYQKQLKEKMNMSFLLDRI